MKLEILIEITEITPTYLDINSKFEPVLCRVD